MQTTTTNKISKSLRLLLILLVIVGGFTIKGGKAEASILYSQLNSTTYENQDVQLTDSLTQTLGTGLSGVLHKISFYGIDTNAGDTRIYWRLYECNIGYTGCTLVSKNNTSSYNEHMLLGTSKTFVTGIATSTISGNPQVDFTFVSNKYYMITISGQSSQQYMYGGSNSYNNGACYRGYGTTTPCTQIDDIYFVMESVGSTYTPQGTEFTTVTPHSNDIKVDPNVSFSATWNITDEDLAKLDNYFDIFDGSLRVTAKISELVDTSWTCQIYTEDFDTPVTDTTSFNYTFDGSHTLCPNANYNRDYRIEWTLSGLNFFNVLKFQVSTSTYFTVGTTTHQGNLIQYVASSTSALKSKYNENGYDLSSCNIGIWGNNFSATDCFLGLIWPREGFFKEQIAKLYNSIFTVFPLGIVTDFIGIISTTTVGTLTPINATLPSALGVGTPSITLDLTNSLDTILNATTSEFNNTSASSTQTFYEITSYYWNIIVYLTFLMYIISRIIGVRAKMNWGKE